MEPRKISGNTENTPSDQDKPKDKPTGTFPSDDTGNLSLSEEPQRPVTVVGSSDAPVPAEPPKPPTSESYSPLGTVGPSALDEQLAPAQPRSRKKRWMLIGLIAGIVALLFGGAAAAYFGYYLPNQPENILKSALVNSFSKDKASSLHFTGTAQISDTATEDGYTIDVTGAMSQEGKLNLSANIDALVATVTFDLRSADGKSYFLKLGGLEGAPELLAQSGDASLQAYGPILAALNDQWYEINQSLIEQLTGTTLETGSLTAADLQKLGQAYDQHPFLAVKETLASETINGRDSYHYKVTVDKTKLKAFVQAVKEAGIDSLKLTQEGVDAFNGSLADVDFSKYPIDVWIAKDDLLFMQVAFKTEENGSKLDLKLTITDYNKPVEVEEPEDAKSIMEALGTIYEAALGTMQQSLLEDIQTETETNGVSL